MISLLVLVVFILAAVGYVFSMRSKILDDDNDVTQEGSRIITKGIAVIVLGILFSIFQPYTYTRVDAGYVGVKVNLTGHDRGISDIKYTTGWVLYNTWFEELYEYPTFKQHVEYEQEQVILKGGFATHITPTFNYNLKADQVTDMFAELRLPIKEIETGWLRTAIMSSVNDVSNRWKVEKIFDDREKFENAIIAECNKRVGKWFTVDLLRTNIVPPASLQKAIEAKTQAIQQAEAENQKVLVAEAEGLKKMALARADSAKRVITSSGKARAMLIEAEAEAEAIRIKQREVSAVYNDYIKANRWDGKLPTYNGTGGNFIFDQR